MGLAAEAIRLLNLFPVYIGLAATLAVMIWAYVFRRVDPNALVMVLALLAAWGVEVLIRAIDPHLFRVAVCLTDLALAALVIFLGRRNPSDWLMGTYSTLVMALTLHALWFLGPLQSFLSLREYVALLNILYFIRLACFAVPGVAHVGENISRFLSRDRTVFTVLARQKGKTS